MLNLKPAFSKEGTVTPANASKIDDAGVALGCYLIFYKNTFIF